jgi:hypothetical protein
MMALLLGLVLAVVLGGSLWLLLGTRLRPTGDPHQDEILSVLAYVALAFPFTFAAVFFGLAR